MCKSPDTPSRRLRHVESINKLLSLLHFQCVCPIVIAGLWVFFQPIQLAESLLWLLVKEYRMIAREDFLNLCTSQVDLVVL